MAGRVNTKFVASLSVGLLIAFGVVAASAYYLLVNSAADLAKAGDRLVAQGDKVQAQAEALAQQDPEKAKAEFAKAQAEYAKAVEYYSKAVNKEQINAAYLGKWRDTLKLLKPETQVLCQDYFRQYMLATAKLAQVQPDNIAVQKENLEIEREFLALNEFSRTKHDRYITQCDGLIALHSSEPAGSKSDVLKRFRGTAKFELYAQVPDAPIETATQAESDLLAALAADPADADAAMTLQSLYMVMADRANARNNVDEAKALREKSDATIKAFLEKNPTDPFMLLVSIQREIANRQMEIAERSKREKVNVNEVVKKMQADLKPRLDLVTDAVKQADPARITPRLIESMRIMESVLDPTNRLARAEEVCRLALAKSPTNALLLAAYADLFSSRDDYPGAIQQLERVIAIPTPVTSLDAMRLFGMKTNARYMMALYQAKHCQNAADAERPALLVTTETLRTQLNDYMAPDSPLLTFLDAQIAYIKSDFSKANRLLDQYLKQTGTRPSPDALLLAAQVADRLNQTGLVKQRLEELLAIAPGRPQALVMLAETEIKLQNISKAREIYAQLLTVMPDNAEIKKRLDLLVELEKGGPSGTETAAMDPVLRDLVKAQELLSPPPGKPARPEELIPFLEDAAKRNNWDWRIVQPLGNAYLRTGQRDKAVELANKGLQLHPESKEAKVYQISVTQPDGPETRIRLIDMDTTAPQIERTLGHYQVYKAFNKPKEAAEALAAAAQLNKDDPRVVEFQFLDAIDSRDFVAASALADRATKGNLDEADGLTFRARLLAAQGNYKDAVTAMEQAVAKGGALPEVWRLKGRTELLLGRGSDAVESFRHAVRLRPNDVNAINDLLSMLIRLGRQEEALALARESEKFGRESPMFLSTWLNLESEVGDKSIARERRETMAKNSPNDRANLVSLAAIYIADRDWAKARPIIDRARAIQDESDVLALDARWNWEQGDRQKARKIFEDFIAGVKPEDMSKMHGAPYVAFAQFLMERQDYAGALTELERARAFQDPKTLDADKYITSVHMSLGSFDKAAEVCRRIKIAGADSRDFTFQKRLAECLMKLNNYADARTEIAEIVAAQGKQPDGTDAVTLMLLADCNGGLKADPNASQADRDKAQKDQRDTLDLAVSRFPGDAMVFLKRGQLQMGDPKTARDAISDFGKALQLRPDMWQALRLRALAYVTIGQMDEAVKDLGSAVKLAPFNDDLLYGLVADLLRMNRGPAAFDIAVGAIAKRPRDVEALMTVGQLFARTGAHQQACRFFKDAFEIDNADRFTQRYLDSLLSMNPPDLLETQRVLNTIGPKRIQESPGFLLAAAKMFMQQRKVPQAEVAARDALKLLKVDNAGMMLAWFNDLRRLIPDKAQLQRYLEETGRVAQAAQAQEWIEYFRTALRLEDPASSKAAVAPARELLSRVKNDAIRQLLYRAAGSALVQQAEYEEAAKVYRDGLGQFPDDVELNNNLAYVLAVYLGKAEEAEPLADKAGQLTPNVADVVDTVGSVKMALKKCKEAAEAFRRATLLASTPEQAVRYGTHLANAQACVGNDSEARDALAEAQKTIDANPSAVSEKAKADLEAARKKIEGS